MPCLGLAAAVVDHEPEAEVWRVDDGDIADARGVIGPGGTFERIVDDERDGVRF